MGQGAMLCCQLRRFFEGLQQTTCNHWVSGKPSAGLFLVQCASPFTRRLIRHAMVLLHLLLSSGSGTWADPFKHKWVGLVFYRWAGGGVHLGLASIKGVTIGRFRLSALHCRAAVYEHLRVLGVETFKYSWVAIHMLYSCVYDSRQQIRNLYFSPTLTVWCRCRPVLLYLEAIQR